MQFFLGLIGVVLGILALKHTKFLHEMVGTIQWAEKFLGFGGTVNVIKIFSLGLTIVSALYMFGML